MSDPGIETLQLIVQILGFGSAFYAVSRAVRELRAATNDRLTTQSFEVIRFLAKHPDFYDLFYRKKQPTAEQANNPDLLYCAEMLANFMEHVAAQIPNTPPTTRKVWRLFIREAYDSSPILQQFLQNYKDWYSSGLFKIVESSA